MSGGWEPAARAMAQSIDGLRLRRILLLRTPEQWAIPTEFGPDGWAIESPTHRVVVSAADEQPVPGEWWRAILWRHTPEIGLPDDGLIPTVRDAVFPPGGYTYMIYPPFAGRPDLLRHLITIYGRADGRQGTPPKLAAPVGSKP